MTKAFVNDENLRLFKRQDENMSEALVRFLSETTERKWFQDPVFGYSALSYANNNMSYAYDFMKDEFMLVRGIDGLGINGKVETIFNGTFEQCVYKFFELRY